MMSPFLATLFILIAFFLCYAIPTGIIAHLDGMKEKEKKRRRLHQQIFQMEAPVNEGYMSIENIHDVI